MRDLFNLVEVLPNVGAAVILLVDDDESVRKSVHRFLNAHGYEVYEARDRTSAVNEARLRHPHIMIVDLLLPSFSGLHIARDIRADPDLKTIHLIAFSATIPDWNEELRLFDRVISKPAAGQVLLDAIVSTLQTRASGTTSDPSAPH